MKFRFIHYKVYAIMNFIPHIGFEIFFLRKFILSASNITRNFCSAKIKLPPFSITHTAIDNGDNKLKHYSNYSVIPSMFSINIP